MRPVLIKRFLSMTLMAATAVMTSACTTGLVSNFNHIQKGMTKAQVIAQIGGPDKAVRRGGADHWTYAIRNESGADEVREIEFESGRATYVGDFRRPQVSADQQDQLNNAAVEADAKRDEADHHARNKMLGIQERRSPSEQLEKSDDLDLKLRDSLYGTESYKASGHAKNITAPVFEEVSPGSESAPAQTADQPAK